MTETVYLVITDNGDGSNGIEFYCDPGSIAKLSAWEYAGSSKYASGDGLQVVKLQVPDLLEFAEMQGPGFYWNDADLLMDEEG